MGAALCPHIADKGWAGFRETKERERRREERVRVQRLSQTSHSTGGGEGRGGGEDTFQPLTSVIRLSRVGKKIAGSILVVAEDEKTRRLNKKTCVAHALRLIGCVPWIIPKRRCQLGKHAAPANAYTHPARKKKIHYIHKAAWNTLPSSVYMARCWSQIYACGLDTLVSNQTSQLCFGLHYTCRCCSSYYTACISSHLGFCAQTHFTKKAKACIICQTKWESLAMFITDTPGVYNRHKNRNRCNSHRYAI